MKIVQLVLEKRPGTALESGDTKLLERVLPEPTGGEFRVKISHVALEVSMIGWMREGRSYLPNINIGDPIRANGVGIVEASRNAKFKEGDLVTGLLECGSHAITNGSVVTKLDASAASAAAWAGALGLTTAFTSFVGMSFIPDNLSGKTVLVTGASGLVGGFAAQFAKARGATVIGTAGNDKACKDVETRMGVDRCLNYNATDDLTAALQDLCPDRIDAFYDNVGGEIFDSALGWMNAFGTVVMCGQTAERGIVKPPPVTKIRTMIMERLAMRGFVVFDHPDLFEDAAREIGRGMSSGQLVSPHSDIYHEGGLSAFYEAYTELVNNTRKGKHVLSL